MKKTNPTEADDMRAECDFASMKGGVRGKYVRRAREGTNIVLIEPEVAAAFPKERAVNAALKGGLDLAGRFLCWSQSDAMHFTEPSAPLDVRVSGCGVS